MRSPSLALVVITFAVASVYPAPVAAQATCIAIALPSVQGVDGDATRVATAVRDLFAGFLKGPSLKTVLLEARLPSQAALEARQKRCGQLLIPSVTRKAGGTRTGSIISRAAGVAATRVPYTGAVGAVTAGAVASGGEALYMLSLNTRKKDEIELGYRLGAPDDVERTKAVSAKAKANTDGEDLLTPLVEKAAGKIAETATAAGGR
jgi:hypothetical protein